MPVVTRGVRAHRLQGSRQAWLTTRYAGDRLVRARRRRHAHAGPDGARRARRRWRSVGCWAGGCMAGGGLAMGWRWLAAPWTAAGRKQIWDMAIGRRQLGRRQTEGRDHSSCTPLDHACSIILMPRAPLASPIRRWPPLYSGVKIKRIGIALNARVQERSRDDGKKQYQPTIQKCNGNIPAMITVWNMSRSILIDSSSDIPSANLDLYMHGADI